jgi:MbtH protein
MSYAFMNAKEDNVTNPFEDENATYHVLINDEGQHSLWPSFKEVPKGWTIVRSSDSRAACLEFINQHWTDMRPNSLVRRMSQQTGDLSHETAEPQARASSSDAQIKH